MSSGTVSQLRKTKKKKKTQVSEGSLSDVSYIDDAPSSSPAVGPVLPPPRPASPPASISAAASHSDAPPLPTPSPATDHESVTEPGPDDIFPSRYVKQAPSRSGNLAYVVFNGVCPGVFYNWETCMASLQMISKNARRYKGYSTYESAHTAWQAYKDHGEMPRTMFPPSEADIAEAEHSQELGRIAFARMRATSPLPSSPHPASSPTISSSQSTWSQSTAWTPHTTTATGFPIPFPHNPERVGLPGHPYGPNGTYIVYEGPRPGVYGNEQLARAALGSVTNNCWLVCAGPDVAFELFSILYMSGRIHRSEA